jgi:hypothetical protein
MPKWLSMKGNCFSAGGFPSNPIPVLVCAEKSKLLAESVDLAIRSQTIGGDSKGCPQSMRKQHGLFYDGENIASCSSD